MFGQGTKKKKKKVEIKKLSLILKPSSIEIANSYNAETTTTKMH